LNQAHVVTQDSTADAAAIRARVAAFAQAIQARDLDGVMAVFAPRVLSFDLGPPLRHGGGEDFRRHWRALFQSWQGRFDYEVRDLEVAADGDVAFSHSLNRTAGSTTDGRAVERWLRWTACWRRIDGRWLIVHEHVSVPADVRTGQALLDLEP
jgi:uncharacterized protein (TIGR02246 family)